MDYIFYNGAIYTMENQGFVVEALGVKGNKIHCVGSKEDVFNLGDDHTTYIDLQGKCLLPGFNDSHLHLINYAYTSQMISLHDCKSVEDIVKTCMEAENQAHKTWIMGRGWLDSKFTENRLPHKKDLDMINEDKPIILIRGCAHIAVVNSKALEIMGISKDNIPVLSNGEFVVDEQGELTGVLRENAIDYAYECIPNPTLEDIKGYIEFGCKKAIEKGITSIQSDDLQTFYGDYELILKAYKSLKDEDKLPLRVYQQCLFFNEGDFLEFIEKGNITGHGDEFFKIGPLKLLADGSLGGRTAKLREAYNDDSDNKGIETLNAKELLGFIDKAYTHDYQVAVHCIGDGALESTLDAFAQCEQVHGIESGRHGIVHCQITDYDLLKRMKAMHIMAYVQPIFIQSDHPMVEQRIGTKRASESYAFKTMMDMGIHTPYGSDCPVEPFDVLKGIHCAVNRQDQDDQPTGGWFSHEKVTVREALTNYTIEGAYASFEENIKGSLKEGKLADLVILDKDPFKEDASVIKNINISMTMVDGKIKFSK